VFRFFFLFFSLCCLNVFGQEKVIQYKKTLQSLYPTLENNFRVTHQHTSKLSKVEHTYMVQTLNGLDICNVVLSTHIDNNGKLVKVNNAFYPEVGKGEYPRRPVLSSLEAITKFAVHLGKKADPVLIQNKEEENLILIDAPGFNKDTIKVALAYFLDKKKIKLVWKVNAQVDNDWWDAKIDALTGAIIEKINWVSECKFDHEGEEHIHTEHCHSNQSMVPNSFNVFAQPIESPIHGPRTVKINPANLVASPYGWNDTDGIAGHEYTTTKGNNVEAKDDIAADNETTAGAFANGGPTLDFNFPFTTNVPAITNLDASLANLFYWNNIIHDVWYQYGFDEAAGNFQSNNYGKGGLANDFVYADGIDGSGTNNANFGTPPDGVKPRMQMYKWNKTSGSINSPITTPLSFVKANFGASNFNVTNQVVQGDPLLGCTPLTNASAIAGKIALIDRGDCEFGLKCLNAQNAGAIAVIICNNVAGGSIAMPPGGSGASVTIPSVMISQADCNTIKVNLNNPSVFVSLRVNEFDSSFDNLVIAHEYGHGISTRLTGGAANSGCLSGDEQMGEGWSDWIGLMLSLKPGQNGVTGRGVGNYLTTQDTNGVGIRPYRYSTSMTTNPHTYNSIKTAVVPHGVGSVWCAMLWEMTWELIDKYGFDADLYNGSGGNNIAMLLVIEAMKLQPCSPGFTDARDAILLADEVLYGGENQCLIWKAFAKRGLGYSAIQGTSRFRNDGSEAFDLPVSCSNVKLNIVSTTNYASPGDTIKYIIDLKNIGTTALNNVIINDTLPDNSMFLSSSSATASGQNITFSPFILPAGDSVTKMFITTVKPSAEIQLDSIVENAENPKSKFDIKNTNVLAQKWSKSNTAVRSGNFSWFALNDTAAVEKYFTLKEPIMPEDFCMIQFWHKYNTETNWDGGKVQVSTDNKLTWQDLGPKMILNGYNGYLDNNPSTPAFSGNSVTFKNTVIDLTSFKGQYIYIRFWMHCDQYEGGEGWYIDDIIIHNSTASVFNKIYQVNNENKNSDAYTLLPVTLIPCSKIYSTKDGGQGTLRRAIQCSTSGDQLSVVEEIISDTILINSTTLVLDKNLLIANIDSSYLHIKSTHAGPAIIIDNNANVELLNVDVTKSNASNNPTISKTNGNLSLDGSRIKISNTSPNNALNNNGGTVIVKGNVVLKRE
jgi:extracellular elastinolytic metalloproteinase